jgi:hypothetical protein
VSVMHPNNGVDTAWGKSHHNDNKHRFKDTLLTRAYISCLQLLLYILICLTDAAATSSPVRRLVQPWHHNKYSSCRQHRYAKQQPPP